MSDLSDLNKCTESTTLEDGRTKVICKLGLWSVDAADKETAYREAMHYFQQYKADGEYSSILGGESVAEKLSED